jgi:hypothetical protein
MAKEEGFKGPPATHKILRIGTQADLRVER